MTPDDVRAIVREELAAYDAERRERAEIAGSMVKVTAEHEIEKLLDSMDLPDQVRDEMRSYMTRMLGSM